MNIEEINNQIKELELSNKEYEKIRLKKREQRLLKEKRKERTRKIKLGLYLSLIGIINIQALQNYKKGNIFHSNKLAIESTKIDNIKSKIENELNIKIEDDKIENYLLLNAILENNKLSTNEKNITCNYLIPLIRDNPYLTKEFSYRALSNVDIIHRQRPIYTKESILAEYHHFELLYFYHNDISIYNNEYDNILEHELIHCLLSNYKNVCYPDFITEGLTELLTIEYYEDNNTENIVCYPYEVLLTKILCEIVTEDTVLESYTKGNMNLIYEKLKKLDDTKNPKEFINDLEKIIKDIHKGKKIDANKIEKLHYTLARYLLLSTNINELEEKYVLYDYYLQLFDYIKEENPMEYYVKKSEKIPEISSTYFNKTLKKV